MLIRHFHIFQGIIDVSMMPHLAYLVDTRYSSYYGSIYAIAQIAVCLAYGIGKSYCSRIGHLRMELDIII